MLPLRYHYVATTPHLQEYCAQGDLHEALVRYYCHYEEVPPTEMRKAICQHILNGLERMHQDRIIHCDLKPENVLFDVRSNR